MFEGEDYRSYIQLCRELRLEREFEAGDCYTAPVPVSVIAPEGFEVLIWVDLYRLPRATEHCVWLPRLDQWLSMLEEAGATNVCIFRTFIRYVARGNTETSTRWRGDGEGRSREEAAARLWMAVAGRTVTSG